MYEKNDFEEMILAKLVGKESAEELLSHYGSLREISTRTWQEYAMIKGIGEKTARRLEIMFTVIRSIMSRPLPKGTKISDPQVLVDFIKPAIKDLKVEKFFVFHLNTANRLISHYEVASGVLNCCLVHPREVFKRAITESAAAIILLHNHPSQDCRPSFEDESITKRLVGAGQLLNIQVLDHIIIGDPEYYSFREEGFIE